MYKKGNTGYTRSHSGDYCQPSRNNIDKLVEQFHFTEEKDRKDYKDDVYCMGNFDQVFLTFLVNNYWYCVKID